MKNAKMFFTALMITAALQVSCKEKSNLEEVVEVPEPEKETTVAPIGDPNDVKADEGPFQMVKLPYAYNALEPYIDAKTMEIHYSKHHVKYTNELNKAVKGTPMETKTIEDLLATLDMSNAAVRNNAGGFYNHNFFWEILGANGGSEPKGALAEAIKKDFGSFDNFKKQFSEAATKQFGSGWAWLVLDNTGKLVIGSTPNQDNPLMKGVAVQGKPVLALDVWEHAYYLNYQNKRPDYISAFFNVINWDAVSKKYEAALKK